MAAAEVRAREDAQTVADLEQRLRLQLHSEKPSGVTRLFRTASARPWLDQLQLLGR